MLTLHRIAKRALNAAPTLTVTTRHFSTTTTSPPSPDNYDDLINAAGRDRNFAAVRQLLTDRVNKGSSYNTTRTFKFIHSDISSLDDLLANLATIHSWFARKHAHDSLVAAIARSHRTCEALRVAETMVKNNYGATCTTFHPIINYLVRRKKNMEEALHVLDVMRDCKIRPDTTAFNYIVTAYCFVGDLRSASEVLVRMEEEGLCADERTYDALVLGACRAGMTGGALWLVRRMVGDGVEGLYATHAHVIKAMVRSGYNAQAVEYVRSFAGRKEKLDVENYGYLGRRLRIAKRVEEAKMVVEEMGRRGLPISDELVYLQKS